MFMPLVAECLMDADTKVAIDRNDGGIILPRLYLGAICQTPLFNLSIHDAAAKTAGLIRSYLSNNWNFRKHLIIEMLIKI